MKVHFSVDDFASAANVAMLRLYFALHDKRQDKLYDKKYTEHLSKHFLGACGELTVAKAMGVHWPASVNTFKSAPDILPNIEVRHRLKHDHDLIVRQDDNPDSVYVLSTGDPPDMQVVGWIEGRKAMDKKWLRSYGGWSPAYFVPQKYLNKMEDLHVT